MPILVFFGLLGLEVWLLMHSMAWLGRLPVGLWVLSMILLGLWVMRQQGLRALGQVQRAALQGYLPGEAMLSRLLALLGGVFLLLPGYLSDLIGLSLLIPAFRQRLSQRLTQHLAQARPDLRQPVTLDGDFRVQPQDRLKKSG